MDPDQSIRIGTTANTAISIPKLSRIIDTKPTMESVPPEKPQQTVRVQRIRRFLECSDEEVYDRHAIDETLGFHVAGICHGSRGSTESGV